MQYPNLTRYEKDIALVLSSGGARGFAHIGAIKVLKSRVIISPPWQAHPWEHWWVAFMPPDG